MAGHTLEDEQVKSQRRSNLGYLYYDNHKDTKPDLIKTCSLNNLYTTLVQATTQHTEQQAYFC